MASASSVTITKADGITNTNQFILFNPSSQLPIKLSGSSNFTTWKAQFELLLHGHDLFGYLDGSITVPANTITEEDKQIINPDYKIWFRQEKLIQNALLASVEPTLASIVATATSSKAAWDSLHMSYANKSHTQILSLKDQLSRLVKNNKPVSQYLHEVRTITDELAVAGSPVSNSELVVKILGGLGSEYNNIGATIRARENPISYKELSGLLQDQEICLTNDETKNHTTPVTITVAQREPSNRPSQATFNKPRYVRRQQNSTHWRNLSAVNNTGRPWRNSNTSFPSDASRNTNRIRCQLCEKPGHIAKVCRSKSYSHVKAKANFVSSSAPWIVDSGASHHITSDAHNFSEVHGYHGPDEVSMGNVLKFYKDNYTSIEFFPTIFYVKDLKTGTPLQIIHALGSRFSLKDLGQLHFFLGIEVLPQNNGLILSQAKYIKDLLHDTNMHESNGVTTPMSSSIKLIITPHEPPLDITKYRKILGKLQYLSFTRPDLSFAVSKLSQFMHHPQKAHWQAIKRVLRYLQATHTYGLYIGRHHNSSLTVYSDSDWAGNIGDRTSTTEYRAVASALAETNWLSNLLGELRLPLDVKPRILCDNIGATYLCRNPVFHSRMKHIAIDFHFVRDQVEKNQVVVTHVPSSGQVVDALTKPLPKSSFRSQFSKIAIIDTTPFLRGQNKIIDYPQLTNVVSPSMKDDVI
ncbi:uncharacterized protein LOC141702915 [Apium graveolens]|uniref:uncharacterized protein LOC141702915 n=1 Tax=Apium graveolens TaxID=4045 RepID=UPI003D7AE379